MLLRSIFTSVLLLLPMAPARPASEPPSIAVLPLLYTVSKSYDPLAWMHGDERFSSDAAIFLQEGNTQRPLVPELATSADPSVSFDGQKILFAGKVRPQDPWQIWEVNLSGGKPRRITQSDQDCIRPFYLPGDRIVYAHKVDGRFVIETSDLQGSKVLPLTYISSNSLPSDVLRDGRILFASGYPLGTDDPPEIYTVYSDGSGIESYRCDHGAVRYGARQVASGDIVFSVARGLARFTSARAQEIQIAAPPGEYAGDLAETTSGGWIFALRKDAASPFHLARWIPGTAEPKSVMAPNDRNIVQPTPVAQRPLPNRHPSGLHDWPNANLLCLNSYTSKYKFVPGSISSVNVYARGVDGRPRLLGTAQVERDGSFFAQVPNDQPIQIELLDAAGKSLKREAGFFWMRRGEQRGCVGCHAGPETAPENAIPQILLKSTTPADLTGATTQSAGGH